MNRVTDPEHMAPYLRDASNLMGGHAEGVVMPESEREVMDFLGEAHDQEWPITVAGHGSGLVGGRIPFGGWVLATDRLTGLRVTLNDETGERAAIVQPGVSLRELQEVAEIEGCFYPPDPTEIDAFVGGTVATNASGGRSFKYGTTRHQVQALRVVLADGQALSLKRGQCVAKEGTLRLESEQGNQIVVPLPSYRLPKTKHAAGYFADENLDAVDLFVGSEGTLGVVTEVELRLLPAPSVVLALVAFFRREGAAWSFAEEARDRGRRHGGALQARTLEYMDRHSLDLLRPQYPNIPPQARAVVYTEQECNEGSLRGLFDMWRREVHDASGMSDAIWTASVPLEQCELKAFRRALPLAINEQRSQVEQPKIGTDTAVPDEHLNDLLSSYRSILDRSKLPYCVFGHIGDNHLHANMMPRSAVELRESEALQARLVDVAVRLGGTISAEHGVGKTRRGYLKKLFGTSALDEMRQIKQALDPRWLLGQGNIFER